jgi:hypothetical protein
MTIFSASYPIPSNMAETIENSTLGLAGVGIVGGAIGPHADVAIIAPVWIAMAVKLASQAGSAMDKATISKLIYATATGVAGFAAGTKIVSTVAGWLLAIPSGGLSLAIGMVGNAALNAKLTKSFGEALARFFLQTHDVDHGETAVAVLTALIGRDFGIKINNDYVVA